MSPALVKQHEGSTNQEQQCLEFAAAQAQAQDEGERPDINNLPDQYFQQEEVQQEAEDNERHRVAELPQVQI